MIVAGDECRRTQRGNNNAYCQDNAISWFDWSLVTKHAPLVRFVRELIRFRRSEPTLRRTTFMSGVARPGQLLPDISWFSAEGTAVDWAGSQSTLTCLLAPPTLEAKAPGQGKFLLLLLNASAQDHRFRIPPVAKAFPWRLVVDTAAPSPRDIFVDSAAAPRLESC